MVDFFVEVRDTDIYGFIIRCETCGWSGPSSEYLEDLRQDAERHQAAHDSQGRCLGRVVIDGLAVIEDKRVEVAEDAAAELLVQLGYEPMRIGTADPDEFATRAATAGRVDLLEIAQEAILYGRKVAWSA